MPMPFTPITPHPPFPSTPAINSLSITATPIPAGGTAVGMAPQITVFRQYILIQSFMHINSRINDVIEFYLDPVGAPPALTPCHTRTMSISLYDAITNYGGGRYVFELSNFPQAPGLYDFSCIQTNVNGIIAALSLPTRYNL